MLEQKFSFRSEEDFFGASDKERVLKLCFQSFDGLTDSGLGNKKLSGSFGEAECCKQRMVLAKCQDSEATEQG